MASRLSKELHKPDPRRTLVMQDKRVLYIFPRGRPAEGMSAREGLPKRVEGAVLVGWASEGVTSR